MKITNGEKTLIRLGLPKGRMQEGVFDLLADAGIQVRSGSRNYRPSVSLPGWEVKILKHQNIVEMLHYGSRDIGFSGADWVEELGADLVDLLDTEMDPVKLVAAAPIPLLEEGKLPKRPLIIASEYEKVTRAWIEREGLDATFVRSYGATEVFPPEDADCIVDNTASGQTLKANNLRILDVLKKSSTRLYANPKAMEDPSRRAEIDRFVMLLESVLQARKRVMLEVNVTGDNLESLIEVLPCMREPTISPLHGDIGYAVKSAVPRADLPLIIPEIRKRGGTDIVVTKLTQIIP